MSHKMPSSSLELAIAGARILFISGTISHIRFLYQVTGLGLAWQLEQTTFPAGGNVTKDGQLCTATLIERAA